jgi:hypothetical protein
MESPLPRDRYSGFGEWPGENGPGAIPAPRPRLILTGLTPALASDGSVVFKDSSGTVQATIPHGYMEDSNLSKVSDEGAMSIGVAYSPTTVNGAPAWQVSLDSAWLHDPDRASFTVALEVAREQVIKADGVLLESPDAADSSVIGPAELNTLLPKRHA